MDSEEKNPADAAATPSSEISATDGVPAETAPAKAEKNFRPLWLGVAALALVAAFLFQWKNGIDQASIAETEDGRVLRAKVENAAFRIFSSDKARPVREVFLCGSDGEILAQLVPATDGDAELFRLPAGNSATDNADGNGNAENASAFRSDGNADSLAKKLRREGRFLHLVLPAEKTTTGQPVVLLVQNPFKDADAHLPAQKP